MTRRYNQNDIEFILDKIFVQRYLVKGLSMGAVKG
jgi:hypothetical protein